MNPLEAQLNAGAVYLDERVRSSVQKPVSYNGVRESRAVLFLSRAGDAEVDVLAQVLSAASINTYRVELDELSSISLKVSPNAVSLRIRNESVDPTIIWSRHVESPLRELMPESAAGVFYSTSAHAFTTQLHSVTKAFVINPTRPGIIEQLSIARQGGVATPETLIHAGPHSIQEIDLPSAQTFILKAIASHFIPIDRETSQGVFPVVCTLGELREMHFDAPVLIQQFVPHINEYRVYVTRFGIVSFCVTKKRADALWTDESSVVISEREAPVRVTAVARQLALLLEADFVAIDVLDTGSDAVVLEANFDGDWLWFEARAGSTRVTQLALDMLVKSGVESI